MADSEIALLDLPDLLLELIAMRLDEVETILGLGCVCKRLKEVASSPTIWSYKLKRDFGLCLKTIDASLVLPDLQKIYRCFYQPSVVLSMVAAYTDGGFEQDVTRKKTWVNHMFQANILRHYNSDVGSNINCFALLTDDTGELRQEHYDVEEEALREHISNRLLMNRIMLRDDVDPENPEEALQVWGPVVREELHHWDTALLLQHFITYFLLLQQGDDRGNWVLYGIPTHEHNQEMARIQETLIRAFRMLERDYTALHRSTVQRGLRQSKDSPKQWWDETLVRRMFQDAFEMRTAGSWKRVTINREGAFTCPVQSVATYTVLLPYSQMDAKQLTKDDAKVFKDLAQSNLSAALNDCQTVDDLRSVCELRPELKVIAAGRSPAGIWAEFAPVLCSINSVYLQPVTWSYFWTKHQAETYMFSLQYVSRDIQKGRNEHRVPAVSRLYPEDSASTSEGLLDSMKKEVDEVCRACRSYPKPCPKYDPRNAATYFLQSEDGDEIPRQYNYLEMTCELTQPRSCNAVMVKLIAAEDLKEALEDHHDGTNIDVSIVSFEGTQILLPRGIALKAEV